MGPVQHRTGEEQVKSGCSRTRGQSPWTPSHPRLSWGLLWGGRGGMEAEMQAKAPPGPLLAPGPGPFLEMPGMERLLREGSQAKAQMRPTPGHGDRQSTPGAHLPLCLRTSLLKRLTSGPALA